MNTLDQLTRQAQALAQGQEAGHLWPEEAEVRRQLTVCNACRYCEGFCAVFPAMTRRLAFERADLHQLAHLCHNCGACLHACQYAPPHEFQLNLPRAMTRLRARTHEVYTWPSGLAALHRRGGWVTGVLLALGMALTLVIMMMVKPSGAIPRADRSIWALLWPEQAPAHFYEVLPHGSMVALFGPIFLWALLSLGIGVSRFMATVRPATEGEAAQASEWKEATSAALNLKYLDGGHGEGCHNEDDAWTQARRTAHHLTFYGFLLCLASTSVATVMHYALGWQAPYDLPSLPKLLGAAGGVAMVVGTAWLALLRHRRHPDHLEPSRNAADASFIALLFLVAASGLALWAARGHAALPLMLCLHLGSVAALFLMIPYGRLGHGAFRLAALVRHAVERRRPNRLGLGDD